ncbi:conserved Plasmodium protein, unknown function [Plasmodium malariae]|uniref:Uncharacterized protein n=1 Tax=Plasmodium malariae TaxID=5858 RepID=A0A1C3KZ70_PLAMA|nr:conserved Plasmodium protein, unknown function [Plasmodium malariae]
MNELKELSKKIKENTNVKKDEKTYEPEIKNLFENFLSNNSINYLSSLINKTNLNDKLSENVKEEINNRSRDIENSSLNKKKNLNNEIHSEQESGIKEDTTSSISKKLSIEKKKENKEYLEGFLLDNKNIGCINVKKVMQNKKFIEFKDLNKLINSFNDEIIERIKNLENFINKNKIKNDYSDKILMTEKFNREMKNIEKKFKANNPLYELYITRKKKKKNYESLLFLKNFFNCLKNYMHFLDKSEKNYKKLKIWKSLIYLRNCRLHILLIQAIFKCVKDDLYHALNEHENNKFGKGKKREENRQADAYIDYNSQFNNITKLDKLQAEFEVQGIFMNGKKNDLNEYGQNKYDQNKCDEEIYGNNDSTAPIDGPDKHTYIKLMEDLKNLFQIQSTSPNPSNKVIFLKEIKIKYDNILNNLKNIVQTIFKKMFVLSDNIKIYKYIYLNSSDAFLNSENIREQKITYSIFWYFAYILKEHTKYLEIIKNYLFLNLFKLMVLFYCIVKNLNGREILHNLTKEKQINTLTYESVKKFVSNVIGENRMNFSISDNSHNIFNKFKNYLFCVDNDKSLHSGIISERVKEINDILFSKIYLSNYIFDNEEYILIDIESFFSNFFLSLECIKNRDSQNILPRKEEFSESANMCNKNDETFMNSSGSNGKMLKKYFFPNISIHKNEDVKNFDHDCVQNDTSSSIPSNEDNDMRNKIDKGTGCHDFFIILSRCMFEFHHIIEQLFVINKKEKKLLDIRTGKQICPEELVHIFNFYFDNKTNKTSYEQAYFNKFEDNFNEEEKLSNIKEKLRKKYQYIKQRVQHSSEAVQNDETLFSLYILNKELNKNVFSFFHKLNLKRNNLTDICNVYYIYMWKKEEQKFFLLIKNIFKNNLIYYLNYVYSILNDLFLFKKEGEYILVDQNIHNYVYNIFFDINNSYNLRNIEELNFNTILRYIEEGQIALNKSLKELVDKTITEKNVHNQNVLNRGNTTKVLVTTKEVKTGDGNKEQGKIGKKSMFDDNNDEEHSNHCSDKNSVSITIRRSNLDCIRIHKKLLYLVFTIYRIVHLSYTVLFKIKENKKRNCSKKNVDNIKNGNSNINEKLKYIININIILFSYKIIKHIYNMFLSYSFFIFRFSCLPNIKNKEEHLLCIINDSIFLKKVLENINRVYMNYKELFNFTISKEHIIFENFETNKDYLFGRDGNSPIDTGTHINRINNNTNCKGSNHSEKYSDSCYVDRKHCYIRNSNNRYHAQNSYNHLKYNIFDKNSFEIGMKQKKREHIKCSPKKNILYINKINILKKIHLFIDKFHLNLNVFKNMFIKIYKQKFTYLLKQDILFIDDQFLINSSKAIAIVFEFFQIQDLCKLIHKDIVLRIIDYFFYLINEHVHNYVMDKRRIDEEERKLLYEKLVFIQNSLSFILNNYRGTQNMLLLCFICRSKSAVPQEENSILKIADEMSMNLINLKKNKILFLLLFCKIKYILNAKKGILEMYNAQVVHVFLSNNPYAYGDENFDAILNEFK